MVFERFGHGTILTDVLNKNHGVKKIPTEFGSLFGRHATHDALEVCSIFALDARTLCPHLCGRTNGPVSHEGDAKTATDDASPHKSDNNEHGAHNELVIRNKFAKCAGEF